MICLFYPSWLGYLTFNIRLIIGWEPLHIYVYKDFNSTVQGMISNGFLRNPAYISVKASVVADQIREIVITLEQFQDPFVWKHFTDGYLLVKHAYLHLKLHVNLVNWSKKIWCNFIPPSFLHFL